MPHALYDARRRFVAILLAGALAVSLLAALLLSGCNRTTSTSETTRTPRGEKIAARLSPERCGDVLSRAFDMLQPERLGVTAEADAVALALNRWLNGCGDEAAEPISLDPALTERLTPAMREAMENQRFTPIDANHVRNALLMKQTVEFAAVSTEEIERVTDLFYYVVENVALRAESSDRIPQTPYETLVLGRGTPEDRGWLFVELLRQANIDAVILRPGDQESDAAGHGLVGVLLGSDVLLYDPALGWPIPATDEPTDSLRVRRPATLAQVVENDALLRQLDLPDEPYPLSSEQLKSPQVDIVGYGALWAGRMRQLQTELAGDRSVVVFDALQGGAGQRGLLDRVSEAGQGRRDQADVGIWTYPQSQFEALERLDVQQSELWQTAMESLSAPRPILRISSSTPPELIFGAPERDQLKSRLRQLQGDFDGAVLGYVNMRRIASDMPPLAEAFQNAKPPESRRRAIAAAVPEQIQALHRAAAEDAFFWSGLSKRMLGNVEGAGDTFRGYLDFYPEGDWNVQARGLFALMRAEQGQPAQAAALLDPFSKSDPRTRGWRLLAQRWRK